MIRESIKFKAPFGDERKDIMLGNPHGGSEGYQVYIDDYYQGTIVLRDGQWIGHLNDRSELTIDDIQILGERIERFG
jgi:hypothetical protein